MDKLELLHIHRTDHHLSLKYYSLHAIKISFCHVLKLEVIPHHHRSGYIVLPSIDLIREIGSQYPPMSMIVIGSCFLD